MDTAEKARHCGRLYVSDEHEPVDMAKPLYGAVYDGIAMINTLMDAWKAYLLLPGHCAITGVFFDVARVQWVLLIESEQFPAVPYGEYPPMLSATYQRQDDGSVKLVEVR